MVIIRRTRSAKFSPTHGPSRCPPGSAGKLVSYSPDAEDVTGFRWIVLDLLADIGDVAVDRPEGDGNIVFPPDAVEKIVPRQDLAASLDKKLQHVELEGGQIELLPFFGGLELLEVQIDPAEAADIPLGRPLFRPPEDGLPTGHTLAQ